VVLLSHKVGGGGQQKIPGLDIGRPRGPTLAQSGISGIHTDLSVALEVVNSIQIVYFNIHNTSF